ncbi:MAG: heme o synthase [Pseudomonadota bacterium]|nr:heme o synthase [Pseudomonadota bacterium]
MDVSADMSFARQVRAFYDLTKPKVVALIVFTAVVGMLLATPGAVPFAVFFYGTLGIALAAASAAAVNQILDRQADARMARTQRRPIPTGTLSVGSSMMFAILLGLASMVILTTQVNALTAVLTFASLIGYAVVYTLYLKRATPQNIVIGGAAGAAPPVLGWTAVTGSLDPNSLLLFLIIFVWTPPHFWALAIHRVGDYEKADIPMLPVTHGVEFTRLQILLYTILLLAVSVMPYVTAMSGLLYLIGALILGSVFLYYALALKFFPRPELPMKTFGYSITYLMGLFALLLVDHYLPLLGFA